MQACRQRCRLLEQASSCCQKQREADCVHIAHGHWSNSSSFSARQLPCPSHNQRCLLRARHAKAAGHHWLEVHSQEDAGRADES